MKTPKIRTCLTFNHQAEEALEFYTAVFKNIVVKDIKRFPTPQGTQFLSANFELFGQEMMVLNGGESFFFSTGFSIFVNCESQEEVNEYWDSFLDKGGKELSCGWIEDPFGVCWQIIPTEMSQYLFDASEPEKAQRALQAMLQMKKIDLLTLKNAYHGK